LYSADEPFSSVKEIEQAQPDSEGIIDHVTFPDQDLPEWFGLSFSGYMKIAGDGVYTFFTESNDGSCLYIDNQLVVDNDGSHDCVERSGQIALAAGLHSFRLYYFQEGGRKALTASVQGPAITKSEISSSAFFHE
jgi:hypothetical protein